MEIIQQTSELAKSSTLHGMNALLRMERAENARCFQYTQSLQRELEETRGLVMQKQVEINALNREIEVSSAFLLVMVG